MTGSAPDTQSPAPTPPGGVFDRRAFLWKVLDRYDIYMGSTLSRASTVTTLNTLLVGYVMLKAGDILAAFNGHAKLRSFVHRRGPVPGKPWRQEELPHLLRTRRHEHED
jgi:hypothetical protein